MDADEMERIFRALLGLVGGDLPAVHDETAMRTAARVAVDDLLLYAGDELDQGLQSGRFSESLSEQIDQSREWCLGRFPALDRRQAPVLMLLEEELQAAIARRQAGLGTTPT